jgi:hypothetical protein
VTDLSDAINDLLGADLIAPDPEDAEDVIVCRDCGRRWTALQEAHCAACCRHFSSDSAFDLHQRLDHRPCKGHPNSRCNARSVCQDPKTLTKRDGSPRLVEVVTPNGSTWAHPGTRPPRERTSP